MDTAIARFFDVGFVLGFRCFYSTDGKILSVAASRSKANSIRIKEIKCVLLRVVHVGMRLRCLTDLLLGGMPSTLVRSEQYLVVFSLHPR